jgi:uncharacterized protein YkwD
MHPGRLLWEILFCASLAAWPATNASANILPSPRFDSADQVIAAVNNLRAQHGLPPYAVSSILMSTAQGQADFMAATGTVQHTGPGGVSVTTRLLNAGYPLAGDRSLGGFRSENIVGSPGMTADGAVESWTGDDIHLHTMLSTDLTEIGAGVAQSGGVNYYVIDCARPLGAGDLVAYTPGIEAAFSGAGDIIVPVSIGTPDANGDLYHEVQAGQSLWQIAYAYGVHIVDIQRLNNLGNSTVILLGARLLIRRVGTPTPAPPTALPTLPIDTPTPLPPTPPSAITATPLPLPTATRTAKTSPFSAGTTMGGIAVLALLGAAIVAWAGRSRPS